MENTRLLLPEDTDYIKTERYLVIEDACKKITTMEITEDAFLTALKCMENLLPDIETEKHKLYKEDGEYTISEAIHAAIELYLQSIQSYKEALFTLREYLKDHDVNYINRGLSMALEANRNLVYTWQIIEKKEEEIKESENFFKQQQMIKRNMANQIFYGIKPQNQPVIKEVLDHSKNKTEVFSVIPLFNVLSREQIEKISRRIKYKKYEKGYILFNYGDTAREVYIIKSGEISIYRTMTGDDTNEFATLTAGDTFGEMGIISDSPRSLSAKVSSDKVELYVISRDDFLYILKTYPEVHLELSRILCERIKENNKRLLEFLSS